MLEHAVRDEASRQIGVAERHVSLIPSTATATLKLVLRVAPREQRLIGFPRGDPDAPH